MGDAEVVQRGPVGGGEFGYVGAAEEEGGAEGEVGGSAEGEEGWVAEVVDVGDGEEGWGGEGWDWVWSCHCGRWNGQVYEVSVCLGLDNVAFCLLIYSPAGLSKWSRSPPSEAT